MRYLSCLLVTVLVWVRPGPGQAAEPIPPYPPSPVIKAIEWAPPDTIVRRAKDSDNWPVTWAGDDALYTTWGDGTGFEPKVEKKLSCGFARVTGAPADFTGVNVRSPAEQLGEGRKGKKGWGILSVGGTLYLWMGHADNNGAGAQLAWSRDQARTWTFADWQFAEFGLVGFVNFGKDYHGARDDFVYAYSHDGPRPDTPADRFILMRAPKGKLIQRAAWEFLEKLDGDGRPVWTADVRRRGAVFQNPDACLRSAMTYNAALRRYLWWQQLPQSKGHRDRGDTRFTGGFAVYDAPEPWGPWTTAYFIPRWDVGPGEHGDFPSKWMSADGRTMHLVFSGDDCFCVRRATVRAGVSAAAKPSRTFAWPEGTPESQGMSSAKLDALWKDLEASGTKALLVVRNDHIVYEKYAAGWDAMRTHYTASMAKALVGGLALAVGLSDGRIALDDKAAKYVPQWKDDPRRSQITIRHLGSHTSGIEDAEADGLPHDKLTGWKGDFWKRHDPPNDPFTISRDKAPVLFAPGEKFHYSNPGIAMLGYAVTAALKDAPQKDLRTLLRDRVMRPIGVPDKEWSVGYGKTFAVDGLPLVGAWGGGNYTPRAVALVGRLMLRGGDWEGKQLVSKEAVRLTTTDAGTPGNCGMGWWNNNEGKYAKLPRDAFWAAGAGHQVVLVVPSLKLIAVRNGEALAPKAQYADAANARLFEPLAGAINGAEPAPKGAAPYPPSRVVARIDWAPKETIVRRAKGSDNWPLTWADDGHLYGAYGDGNGFDPMVPEKLSLGLARVEGGPQDFKGVNIRSATGEHKGEGAAGKKASGMLMVDGVLYMWVRNAGNAQLAWSADRGRTWTWSDWKFTTSFGCPTFLNFGPNYAGARDGYVYVYSPDTDSAYQAADRMVLARVSRDQVRKRDAYEFFKGLDPKGQPAWTKEIAERGPVFTHPGKCYRTGISYNAGLKRYLWCQVLPQSKDPRGPRFQGGFGVYEAPEPWGPWATVYYTEEWDVGPGDTSSFPTKWMSKDGKAMFLVFSGDDCFSVRKAVLTLRGTRNDER